MPRINNSNDRRYQWKDSQQLGCVASAWCLVELSLWHVLGATTWWYGPLMKESLDPTNRNSGNMVIFPGCLFKSEPSTVYLWDTGSGIAGAQWCFCMLPAWEHFFLQNFSVQKWNLPRYFMGKRGDKKMVNLQTSASPYLHRCWCLETSPGLSLSKHR